MKNNILIGYTVEFLAPFHFGTGLSSGSIDRLVRRDEKGYLMIPGTTMKGVLKEKVEELINKYNKFEFISEQIVNTAIKEEHLKYFINVSVSDRIFGSPCYEGMLYFDDLTMSEMSKEMVSINSEAGAMPADYLQAHQRTQTRIMRQTKTVAGGALFKSEYGNSDLSFE